MKTEVVLKFDSVLFNVSLNFCLMKTEVVLKYGLKKFIWNIVNSLMKTEVVLKFDSMQEQVPEIEV